MTQLKLTVALVGMGLLVLAVVLDVTLGRPEWGRMVGWVAIAVLLGAVAIRIVERRRARSKEEE